MFNTKLYIPPPRRNAVLRLRLIERLNGGLDRRLTLISAPAGSGKSTLAAEWLAGCGRPAAWLSLDEGDNDISRFLSCLIAALRTVRPRLGEGVLGMLQSGHTPPIRPVIASLLNEAASAEAPFILALDDYHTISSTPVNEAVAVMLEHLPPSMHIVIAARSEPRLPLPKLRVRHQLNELRAADLNFTLQESSEFLNGTMGLDLPPEHVALLEQRTEGWIAGLQLAAISIQGKPDAETFIRAFSGGNNYVFDYLAEETLQQLPERTRNFLLATSILERMCLPLCEAVLLEPAGSALDELHRANLFIIPLDAERRWYRYHHLFGDLLRRRLLENGVPQADSVAELHVRASRWYERNGYALEAFQHAVAAGDTERAARLVEGNGLPLHFRGALTPVLDWHTQLDEATLNRYPALWVMYASALLMAGRITAIEPKLAAAEAALQHVRPTSRSRDLIGHIASIRAAIAVSRHDADLIEAESRRALDCLLPDNLPVRTATIWTLGYAHHLRGDRRAASRAYSEAIALSKEIGHLIIRITASTGLAAMQESSNRLYQAAETYRHVLQLAGEPPLPIACESHLGLARIHAEWNEPDTAMRHAEMSLELARLFDRTDRIVLCELALARLYSARGDQTSASSRLARAEQLARQHGYERRLPEVAEARIFLLLRQGRTEAAARLADSHDIPVSRARVLLACGRATDALAALEPALRQAEAKEWDDERLRIAVVRALTLQAARDGKAAKAQLRIALAMAEPGGYIRLFADEGPPMARLLSAAAENGFMQDYIHLLIAAFEPKEKQFAEAHLSSTAPGGWIEPLSERELEVLQLVAQGLSNEEIGRRLYLALSSVKGHNRNIFDKLQVRRRTEAVARARELGLL